MNKWMGFGVVVVSVSWALVGCGVTVSIHPSGPSIQTANPAVHTRQSPSPKVTPTRAVSSSSSSSQSSKASNPAATNETVTLPVSIISPTFGASAVRFSYPPTVTVTAPVSWASQIQAVGAVGFVVITPKGWTGQASEGADGSRSVALYPPTGSAKHGFRITIQTASACVGCAWYGAAPYFSWVRQHFSSAGWGTYTGPVIPGYAASSDLSYYQAPNTSTGLHVNGIAYAPFILNPQATVLFRQAETVLPRGEHGLATLVLNQLLNQLVGS